MIPRGPSRRISLPGSLAEVCALEDAVQRVALASSSYQPALARGAGADDSGGHDSNVDWEVILVQLAADEPVMRRSALHGVERGLPFVRTTLTEDSLLERLFDGLADVASSDEVPLHRWQATLHLARLVRMYAFARLAAADQVPAVPSLFPTDRTGAPSAGRAFLGAAGDASFRASATPALPSSAAPSSSFYASGSLGDGPGGAGPLPGAGADNGRTRFEARAAAVAFALFREVFECGEVPLDFPAALLNTAK